jgi:RNA-directed DNA polymerase
MSSWQQGKQRELYSQHPSRTATRDTGSEEFIASRLSESPTGQIRLMESICERSNMRRAIRRVIKNGGAPGVDGMTVRTLKRYFKRHRTKIERALLEGIYRPMPVRQKEIPKPGGVRVLGIPTARDRAIQQATAQVLTQIWDHTFSESSFGFRPNRCQHDAIRQYREYVRSGLRYVVDIDLSKFLETSSYYTSFDERFSKRVGWMFNTLIRKPFLFPVRRWTAESSPRFTRCNTVCLDTPSNFVASCMGT